MGTWGVELWDQRDVIESHTQHGINFLDKVANFMKERVKIEQDYSKALRKLVKQFAFKKKEEDDIKFTYQSSFKKLMQEIDDYAGQREVIAENLQEKILKEMTKLSAESKLERKKAIHQMNELKQALENVGKALTVAKKKYDQASDDADVAQKAYETANSSMELTKAHILKFQKTSQDKGNLAAKAKDDYRVALDTFNKHQTLYYQGDLPTILNNEIQKPEEKRIELLGNFIREYSGIHQNVQPIIQQCLEGFTTAGNMCDPAADSTRLIEDFKSGESPPDDQEFEESGTRVSTSNLSSSNSIRSATSRLTTKPKIKGNTLFSNKKKEVLNDNIANDFSDLPPAQRKKKFQKRITSLEEQIQKLDKDRDGMAKIAETCQQFGGDLATIQGQIETNNKACEKLKSVLYQYQCYLAALDETAAKPLQSDSATSPNPDLGTTSPPVRSITNEPLPPPPPDTGETEEETKNEVDAGDGGDGVMSPASDATFEEFDELRCTVLYDFSGNSEGEISIYAGEEMVIVEEDDGSGWTRVAREDEEGYVPTSYVQKI